MPGPVNPPCVIGEGDRDLPAYVSNGLIGLRVHRQPLQAGMAQVSGYVGEDPARRIQAAAPAPYPLAGDLSVDAVWLSDQQHRWGPWPRKVLDEGYAMFDGGRFGQTVEYHPGRFSDQSRAGSFFANMVGFLSDLLLGRPRVEPGEGAPETWAKAPMVPPAGWKRWKSTASGRAAGPCAWSPARANQRA